MRDSKEFSLGVVMLEELRVTNLGILEEGAIDPSPGLTVLTGETGTGKTLMFGAIELLMGKPFSTSRIGPFGTESRIEARFVTEAAEHVVSKSLAQGGRTKTRLNGNLAAVAHVGELIGEIVDVVAQHDHLSLGKPERIRHLVDNRLGAEGMQAKTAYSEVWAEWEALQDRLSVLGGDVRALERERDLLAYQAKEIADSELQPGEDVSANASADRLRHAEDLNVLLGDVEQTVESMIELSGRSQDRLRKVRALVEDTQPLLTQADSVNAQLGELRSQLRSAQDHVVHDPAALSGLERRLMVISDLRRKYGDTVDEVILFGQHAAERELLLTESLSDASNIEAERATLLKELAVAGGRLTKERGAAAARLCADAEAHLRDLGFTTPSLSVEFADRSPGRSGTTTAALHFASDERLNPGPVAQVASGGELSRLVLALYLASGSGGAPVVAFDEIDAGVGGSTALALGRKLATLAKTQQVLCVTHLPQVAAFAERHYCVRRNELGALAVEVEGDERVGELTRMLSGLADSPDGRAHAKELLDLARQ